MKRLLSLLFLWSWLVSVPITVIGSYWTYRSIDRFYTYSVRYTSNAEELRLSSIGHYEVNRLAQQIRANISGNFDRRTSQLQSVHLFFPESSLSMLESHMPQSGFDYVKGRMMIDGKLSKVELKYRGDTPYRWAWDKKSMRIKTSKDKLYEGMRSVNLLAARSPEQLNNYLSYRLAELMNLPVPRTKLVRVLMNGKDHGIYILVEQPKEIMLRNRKVMPGDLYRGELIPRSKDDFTGGGIFSLFDSAVVWDKVAFNNHYDEASKAPLSRLIALLKSPELSSMQVDLGEMIDLPMWGRFSAFESLTQNRHVDDTHNWRLYYDPWRQKFLPVVWDSMGWYDLLKHVRLHGLVGIEFGNEIIGNRLMKTLFQNGDFIRARSHALRMFVTGGKHQAFLRIVSETVRTMESEVQTDPFLLPTNPEIVKDHMRRMEVILSKVLTERIDTFLDNDPSLTDEFVSVRIQDQEMGLVVRGKHPVARLRLTFSGMVEEVSKIDVSYQTASGEQVRSLSGSAAIAGNLLIVGGGFLPNLAVAQNGKDSWSLHTSPGYYRIRFEGLDPELKIVSVEVDRGNGWLPAESVLSLQMRRKARWGESHWETFGKTEGRTLSGDFVDYVNNHPDLLAAYQEIYMDTLDFDEGKELESADFGQLYAPVAAYPLPDPVIWSGTVTFAGHQILKDDLIIQPGTTVRFAPDATLVLKGRLLAEGTPERPIRFLSQQADQSPWGAIVLMGQGANGSRLTHCEMAGGSGRKGDLFEYSAMFSVHDVKDVSVQDCLFRDNRVVDDMVHTVYADIRFERTRFKNAFADALDLDISEAVIIDSRFDNSGNDAVDLMTTRAHVVGSIFVGNGDKGISVGENSQLCAVNNRLVGNAIGVESKDRSTAVLFNHSFVDNKIALHAYKKNWRYGGGGRIFITKSVIFGSEEVAAAKKESAIHLFDSYVDQPLSGKRVSAVSVDGLSRKNASRTNLFPNADEYSTDCDVELIEAPELLRQHIQIGRRGDYING